MATIELLLDTDVLAEVLRGRPEAVAWVESRSVSTVGIPVIAIPAIAVRVGAPLSTFSTAHFRVIPGLDVRLPYERSQQ